jgi:hypothetical protein
LPKLLGATPHCGESGVAWACHSYMVPHLIVARVHGVSGMVSQGRPPQRSASPDTLLLSFAISQQTCATINRVWRHKTSLACWAGLAGHTTRSTVPWPASHWPHMHHRRKRSSTFAHLVESRVKLADELKPKRVDSAIINPHRHNIACSRVPHRRRRKGSHWRWAVTNNGVSIPSTPAAVPDALGSDRDRV